jgi:hypothetical protein
VDKAALHIGAVAFIHRFGSSLNEHVHFHVCVVDGVFEAVMGAVVADEEPAPPSVIFHPATGIDADAVTQVQATLRKRILRAFVARGLLESFEAKEMLGVQTQWFLCGRQRVHPSARPRGLGAAAALLRTAPFALERLRKAGSDLVYRCAKQHSEPSANKRGAKVDELTLTPLELIDRIAALVPPPRTHRHRYFGVLAPNSPLRATAVAMAAAPTQPTMAQTPPTDMGLGASGMVPPGNAQPTQPDPVPLKRPAHYCGPC